MCFLTIWEINSLYENYINHGYDLEMECIVCFITNTGEFCLNLIQKNAVPQMKQRKMTPVSVETERTHINHKFYDQ